MGYCMRQLDESFRIARNRIPSALRAMKRKLKVREKSMEAALLLWGWDAQLEPETGDIAGLSFVGEKYHEDERMFRVLAPYVEKDSRLVMIGEDDQIWRWSFDGRSLIEQEAMILFRPKIEIVVRGGVAEVMSAPEGVEVNITDYDNEARG